MAYESLINQITSNPDLSSLASPNLKMEPVIQIDSGLRTIIVPSVLEKIGVTGDQNAETLQFQIPRYFDGRDLMEHTVLIRFVNAGGEYGEYVVTDKKMISSDDTSSNDDDYIVFSWIISNYVTRYAGNVSFTVQFETIDDGIEYQWQTLPATLIVQQGINTSSTITDKDDSLYRDLINRMSSMETRMTELEYKVDSAINLADTVSDLLERVSYLEDNVVYTVKTSDEE